MERFSLDGRAGIVTGGASGLGRAQAEAIAEAGGRVHILDIDGDRAAEVARSIGTGQATAEALDVGDREALRGAIASAARRFGRLDVVFANAGVSAGPGYGTEQGRIANIRDADWDRVLAVNLTSVMVTIQTAAELMAASGGGSIVATASIAGLRSEAMVGYAYAATKAAVINLVRQAAMEFAVRGVRVNAIAPGPFRTNIGGGRLNDPQVVEAFRSMVPMGRIASPEEVKGLAIYLASDASSFMTGVTIPLDGGITAG